MNLASQDLNDVTGPEDIQSIGLTCRESLIELATVLASDNPNLLKHNDLKAADFKGITKAVVAIYAQGKSNSNLRKHCRSMAEIAWDHSSEIVHSPNKNIPDAKICLLFTCSVVSIFQNLYFKHLGFDAEPKCPECKSMDYDFISTDQDSIMVMQCNSCGNETAIPVEIDEIE